jgi:hypothetical protein
VALGAGLRLAVRLAAEIAASVWPGLVPAAVCLPVAVIVGRAVAVAVAVTLAVSAAVLRWDLPGRRPAGELPEGLTLPLFSGGTCLAVSPLEICRKN